MHICYYTFFISFILALGFSSCHIVISHLSSAMTQEGESARANFFPYTIESMPVHRKHHKFPRDPDFQVSVAVSILRVLNVWQEFKLMNIPPDSNSEVDSKSETCS